MGKNEEISLIAYYIWLEERCCHGYNVDHWLKAEKMWEEQQRQKAEQESSQAAPASVPVPIQKKSKRLSHSTKSRKG